MKNKFILFAGLAFLCGCQGFNPVPAWNRSGEYYSLTRDYNRRDENGRDFCGLGKAMAQGGWTGGQMAMIALPLPTLFLGIPIAYAEKFTICPLIDTLMLPRDLYIRKSLRDEATAGVLLELKDYWGRPATNLSFGLRAVPGSSDPRDKVFYDGRRGNAVLLARRTDAQGQHWFPLAPSTCEYLNFNVSAWTCEGRFYGREDKKESTPHHKIVRLEPGSRFTPRQPEAPFLHLPSNVVVVSECLRRELTPVTCSTYENDALDLYCGPRNIPDRPADFDAYWDGERARLDREVPFAARLSPVETDRLDGLDAFAVEFPSFGRNVYGFLTRPKAGGQKYPVRIRVSSEHKEFSIENLVADSNAVTLAINALPCAWPKRYDCVADTGNGVRGIEKSREDYFYHPVVLGAARGVSWLLDQPYADASRSQIEGIGQGGGLGLWLMAFEPRIARGMFVEPSHLNQLSGNGSWPRLMDAVRHEVERFRAKARPNIPYFDTFNFVPRIAQPVELATSDEYKSPCSDVFALFRALPENPGHRLYFCPEMARTNMLSRITSPDSRCRPDSP